MNLADFTHQQTIDYEALKRYLGSDVRADIKPAGAYAEGVADLMHAGKLEGETLPWRKTHGEFRFRPGELTLWHGINGHGKSAVVGQVQLWLALNGIKSCVGSFEMQPRRTLYRMLLQAAGNPAPTNDVFVRFMFALTKTVYIFDKHGRVQPKYLFAAMRYCASEKGVKHFFIDSLMKCVPNPDDHEGQAEFVNDLCDVLAETGMHGHLVHHCRKGENEEKPPSKFDAKGSGTITDLAHNVIAVWRNKRKERELERAAECGIAAPNDDPDFVMICDKQRNGNWEGKWSLWGDAKTYHFRESAGESWNRGYNLPEVPQ